MYRTPFPRWLKQEGRKTDHSPLFTTEVKNARSYNSTSLYCAAYLGTVTHLPSITGYNRCRNNNLPSLSRPGFVIK
jgi:hypothetical protein